ncbi:MAG: hypothetical protein DMF68_08720 [Acidobacteria bacterium]|nr:MAG: hypothetical protein DMF68_08720 [Acidobacteriota bacterium]
MRCEECLPLVEEYFDGELDEPMVNLVAEHVTACARCATEYQKLEREQELYLSYECDAEVAPAFWNNVKAQAARESIRSPKLSQRFGRLFAGLQSNFSAPRFSATLTASIVLVAIGITAGVMLYINSRGKTANTAERISQKESTPATASQPAPNQVAGRDEQSKTAVAGQREIEKDLNKRQLVQNRDERKANQSLAVQRGTVPRTTMKTDAQLRKQTPDQLIREAEQKYLAAIAMLSRDVSRHRSKLDSETAMRFERTLAEIDRTIMDTRRAVREHPGDPIAAQYMLTAYAKKVDVLREMIGY